MRTHGKSWVALAVLLVAATVAHADKKVDEAVPCAADGTVSISNVSGRVDIVGWDRKEVRVTGTLGDDVKRLRIDPEDGDVEIEVELPRRTHSEDADAVLEVHVPHGARVEVETVSAPISVKGTKGELELESVSGSIDVDCEEGGAELATVSGSIDVRGRMKRVEAESVSGSVELRETSGDAEVSTTSGGIEIRGGDFRRVSCASVSGRIRFEGKPAKDAELEFENFSGSILLLLPSDLNADVEAETFSGSIRSDFGGSVHREEYGPGASLEETYGDGSAELTLSSFSGSIELKKMK